MRKLSSGRDISRDISCYQQLIGESRVRFGGCLQEWEKYWFAVGGEFPTPTAVTRLGREKKGGQDGSLQPSSHPALRWNLKRSHTSLRCSGSDNQSLVEGEGKQLSLGRKASTLFACQYILYQLRSRKGESESWTVLTPQYFCCKVSNSVYD